MHIYYTIILTIYYKTYKIKIIHYFFFFYNTYFISGMDRLSCYKMLSDSSTIISIGIQFIYFMTENGFVVFENQANSLKNQDSRELIDSKLSYTPFERCLALSFQFDCSGIYPYPNNLDVTYRHTLTFY